uniref:Uncharacterized protein n=1 Tax=Borrelia puertoricensis TaxID=2756107 RepID=A0AA51YMZ4_9SPIR|nr:hypothetical protein MHINFGKF_00029 [Borrelia puertoricensis]
MQKLVLIAILTINIWVSASGKSSYSDRKIGFGGSIGNPIFNYIMSFPFIDLEIGYGGTNGINLSEGKLKSKKYDFNVFVLSTLDLILTIPLIEKLSIGTGIGGNIHISSNKSNFINMEIGFGFRIPMWWQSKTKMGSICWAWYETLVCIKINRIINISNFK